MDLSSLKSLARLRVPQAPSGVVSDANLVILLNNGVLEITRKTKCLPVYSDFNTVADQMEYSLITQITDYLCPLDKDLMHIYYYDGSEWAELDIVTLSYLNANHSNWQSDDSGTPERAVILGDTLYLHPKPDTAVTNGIRFYHCKKPIEMSANGDYPFGNTAEISRLTPYHTIIVDYWVAEAFALLDINDPGSPRRSRAENKYINSLMVMKAELDRDVNQMLLRSPKARFKVKGYGVNPF